MVGLICAFSPEPDHRDFMIWVYNEFKNLMYSTAYKYTESPDTADEIVQGALVNLIKKVETLRPMKRCVLAGYIVTTVRNASINELKNRAHHYEMTVEYGEEDIIEELSLERLIILKEQKAQLKKIWPHLPVIDQIVLEGKYILGYSDQELAGQLGCKPESVRMKLTRARRHALTLLANEGVEYYDEA